MVICNPPYGERIGEEKEWLGLYAAIGETIGEHWPRLAALRLHEQRPAWRARSACPFAAAHRFSTGSWNASCGSLGLDDGLKVF